MTKDLFTLLITAHEGVQDTSARPLLYLIDVDAVCANGCMHVEVHVERRVPPLSKTAQEKGRVAKAGALA